MFRFKTKYYQAIGTGLVLTGCLLAKPAVAQSEPKNVPNYLEQVRRMNEVAAQKIEAEVREAVGEANRLVPTDPGQAIKQLKTTLIMVHEDTNLPENRRESLIRMLQFRIRSAERTAQRGSDTSNSAGSSTTAKTARRRNIDEDQINSSLESIQRLRRDGKIDEAKRMATELALRHPESAAAQAASRTTTAAAQLASIRSQRDDKERRLAAVTRDVDRSALPPAGEVEFPADWKEKTKNRSNLTKLTAKEKAIVDALNTPISVSFKESRFEEAINNLSTLSKQPIIIDKAALQEAQVNYDTPVTLELKGVALRTVLRRILGEFGLTYVIKEQTIQVTSALKAKEMMVVRSYYIGDLLGNGGIGGFKFQYGIVPNQNPLPNPIQMAQQIKEITELIQTSVDPQSWSTNGGPGTISFYAPTMSLIIRQSAEVHAMLGGGS